MQGLACGFHSPLYLVCCALPSRLIQKYTGTHRHIQTFHAAQHRNTHQLVAIVFRQAAQTLAFRSQHKGDGTGVLE
jgi:hypothetical protein